MPIPATTANPEVVQLRARARQLRCLAGQLAERSVADVRRRAGDDAWRGPVADRCRDDLATAQRRLDSAADELRHHALAMERRADEAELRAATAVLGGLV